MSKSLKITLNLALPSEHASIKSQNLSFELQDTATTSGHLGSLAEAVNQAQSHLNTTFTALLKEMPSEKGKEQAAEASAKANGVAKREDENDQGSDSDLEA